MPRFTATRKRIIAAVTLAVGMSGVALWIGGVVQFGFAPPMSCLWTDTQGDPIQRSISASIAEFDDRQKTGWPLSPAEVTCSLLPELDGPSDLSPRGLTAYAEHVFAEVDHRWGFIPYGGFEPGGAKSGHTAGSDHYSGRAIDYFFRPREDPAKKEAGWQLAQWAVIHADELHIKMVIYDRRIWHRATSALGWRDYDGPDGATTNPILLHLDHVHISVY